VHTTRAEDAAVAFNDAINAGSIEALARLMTVDHRFVDSAGVVTEGKPACLEAWRGFFTSFPEYRNHFDEVGTHDDLVVVRGRSRCDTPELDGPALWSARVLNGLVSEWRVHDDTAANRRALGIIDT
jgi:ketosteroid isomerase-like protein